MPGVLGVFTAADLGLEPSPSPFNPTVARTLLASDRVRYVGEPIAAVVAETRAQADRRRRGRRRRLRRARGRRRPRGGADVVDATSTRPPAATPCSTRPRSALPDLTGDEFFADCEVTATGRFINQRVAPCPLEVRGSAAAWIDGRLHQWVSTQHAQGIKGVYRRQQQLEADQVRVITPDVGGGFGAKIGTYPEEIAARRAEQARSTARCAGPRPAASR